MSAPTAEFQQAGKPVAQPQYLVDSNGNPISSFGGGTQYTDGQTPPANPVGTVQVFDNSGTWVDVGNDHPLPVSGTVTALHGSAVDATNSSTATLTANSVYTGTWQSSLNYSALSVEAWANVASAASGLQVQQSQDATNADTVDSFSVSASTAFQTTVNLTGKYYRVVYTNGGTNQATFRLQTVAQTQDVVLPRALSALGNLKVALQEDNTAGLATAANQTTGNSSLSTIATNTTGVATAANQSTANSSLSSIATNTTGLNSTKGTAIQASATGAAGAATTATLAGTAGKTTYMTGFTVIAGNVAAVVSGLVTITGLATTLNYYLIESVTAGGVINVSFKEPVPASAQNTAIVVNVPAITSGGVISIAATGFQL